ncbi:Fimbrin [Gossypium arboreum]|uniref:Fimbrin n=1 Tax=Gossypium arboreum TaxID=29729 RepID=A0A0B0M9E5_GOSAR|nr:Fimbrin [Gossypium arboreum]
MAPGEDGEVGGGFTDAWEKEDGRSGGGKSEDGAEKVGEELRSIAGGDVGACSDGGENRLSPAPKSRSRYHPFHQVLRLCKAANEEHARDLPVMNGIKEDMKSIGVMDYGTPASKEGLSNLSTRLKSLQKHCKEHFDEEEKDVLPLLEATELSGEEEKRVFEDCIEAMKVTHSHLFNFFLEGLLPSEAMDYVDLIMKCGDKQLRASMIQIISNAK